ncbi:MAG TPA: hypothetical protein VFO85_20335, partial [Vicinamibacteria bacterium]|nr:hypothetical protein [Vicinamibacteria bacterium]
MPPRPWLLAVACLLVARASAAEAPPLPAPFGRYEVEATAGGRELAVEARFHGPAGATLEFEGGMGAFVSAVQLSSGGAWTEVALRGDALPAGPCARAACRVRYRVL